VFSGKQLSKFDPQDRGLSRFQKRLQRFFPERQLIVRSGERMRTLRLSTNRQAILTAVVVLLGGWTALSSSLVMNHNERIRSKNVEIKDARMGYEQLLAQVSIYKERVVELTTDLEDNYSKSLALVEKESDLLKSKAAEVAQATPGKKEGIVSKIKAKAKEVAADPAAALSGQPVDSFELAMSKAKLDRGHADADRKALLAELSELETSMVEVVGHHEKTPFIMSEDLELRQVVLQRDLAVSERDTLGQQVAALQSQIRDMESNQLLLYHRFAEVAEDKIAGIEASLSITGLDIDLLLKRQRGRGQGGPLVPMTIPDSSENAGPIQESLNQLNARVDRLTELQTLVTQLPLDAPVPKFEINSGFGVRKDPFTGQFAQHMGLDMGAAYKTSIASTGEGKVIYAGWEGNYGRLVEVDHGMGLITRYGHMSRISVKVGDDVVRGSVLGQLGCSGRCSGPHVHYEVLHNGKPLNPLKFLKAGSNVFSKG